MGGQGEHRGQEKGQAHRLRKEERYKGCPNAAEAVMDEAHASPPPPPPPIPRGQEDRPPPLPRALPEGEGQRVQEQARPHGVYPQEEGQKARSKMLTDQAEARRNKVKEAKKRREERQAQKRAEMLQNFQKEEEQQAAAAAAQQKK